MESKRGYDKEVITIQHVERDRERLNRINKTKIVEEKHESDFQAEKEEYERKLIQIKKERAREEAKLLQKEREEKERIKYERDYARIFEKGKSGNVVGVKPTEDTSGAVAFEEDFM